MMTPRPEQFGELGGMLPCSWNHAIFISHRSGKGEDSMPPLWTRNPGTEIQGLMQDEAPNHIATPSRDPKHTEHSAPSREVCAEKGSWVLPQSWSITPQSEINERLNRLVQHVWL